MLTHPRRNGLLILFISLLIIFVYSSIQAAPTATLSIIDVSAPDINCVFDTDCTITVSDTVDYFTPPGALGDGFLQSRTFPVGEPGTAAAGLYGYLYRIDLREATGATAISCVSSLSLEFGPIIPLAYDAKTGVHDIFVITSGGLGDVAPSSAEQIGDTVTFYFSSPICAGDSPGDGESSFFFGLTSAHPPADVEAHLQGTLGLDETLHARAPQAAETELACGGTFPAIADSYVNQTDPTANYGSLEVLRTDRVGGHRDSLFQFDLSSIPSGATIHDASLELTLVQWEGDEPYEVILNNLANPWDESTVTWESHPQLLTNYGLFIVTPPASGPVSFNVTNMVADWVAGTAVNNGLAVAVSRSELDAYTLYWASREESDPVSARPRLIVDCSVETGDVTDLTLTASKNQGRPAEEITLTGSGYTPGGYVGTVRWDGTDLTTVDIPSGGDFSIPFTIPAEAPNGSHTITVCAGAPCFSGEFEQSASVSFEVSETTIYLPLVIVGSGGNPAPEFTVEIDETIEPAQVTLPELGGQKRPLAAMTDPNGNVATFVSNELVVQTDDDTLINRILADYEGEILLEIDPTEADITDLPKMYLIRVNLSTADAADLAENLTALDGGSEGKASGEHRLSSEDGATLLNIASAEALNGHNIGLNWISGSDDVPYVSIEAGSGGSWGSIPYNRNAYSWHYMQSGGVQDIGTADAWNALHYGGRYDNRVKIAILDGGFAPNADFPSTATYISVIPGIFDPRNVRDVEGNWHGTNVFQTAMAEADNNFGIVGVAHTVGEPLLVYTSYDYVVSIASVLAARGAGAKVINMSYSADVPAAVSWTVLPFELTTQAVRASGTLLFASAGNDNKNVDDRSCFIVCWENTLHTPCENRGVICVGGLDWNSQYRADYGGDSGSNYGRRGGVHIYAPYLVYAGQDPDNMMRGTNAGIIAGTSFSSPYTAGVAGLIWAANPSLSANEVWAIMRDTAHSSPDPDVPRYVDAYEAVLRAMNLAVSADLTSPVDGRSYQKNRTVTLRANIGYVANSSGIPVTVQWSSSRDGVLGTQTYTPGRGAHGFSHELYPSNLSEGTHTIRVRVTAGGVSDEETVTITIENTPPTANIDQPANNTEICVGETITFRGSAFDPNQLGGLPDSAFAWNSSLNGGLGSGADVTRSDLSVGTHTITLTVTDDGGLTDTDTITFIVLADTAPGCEDLAPTAEITSPANSSNFFADQQDGIGWYKTITFEGTIGDTEDNVSDLTVEWFGDREGDLTPISVNDSTGFTTVTDRIHADCTSSIHVITLRVTDTAGNITEDQITIFVSPLC